MKRLALGLVALVALLVAGDRAAAGYAARSIGERVQDTSALESRPDVDVTGFPFLTQAVSGRYQRIDVRAVGVPAGDRLLSRLDATLLDVDAALSDVVSGAVTEVPVGSVTAHALVAYDQVAQQYEDRRLVVEPQGDRLRITGELEVLGQTLVVVAVSRVEVADGDFLLTAEEIQLGDGGAAGDVLLTLRLQLDRRVPVGELPYGLTLTAVHVQPDGLELRAEAADVVVRL